MLSYLPFYQAYQFANDMLDPIRSLAQATASTYGVLLPKSKAALPAKIMLAGCEMFDFGKLTHESPPFNINKVKVGRRSAVVTEEVVSSTPFCELLHFRKNIKQPQPKILVVAPMSGHFATLLRNTVETLLQDHDVYITDWLNVRDIPLEDGEFGLDDYVEHIINFLAFLGEDSHLLAVCQPSVPALVAAAVMAEDKHPAQPRSMTLMAGPIDTRINPTVVNELATDKPIEWFERTVVGTVPSQFAGSGRRVYPGVLQIAAFMGMNPKRHLQAFAKMFANIVKENHADVQFTRDFYEEYFAIMDLSAEFYLETVYKVFQDYQLAKGTLEYRGRTVKPELIKHTALFTVEGERDDICALGQTLAAQDLCKGLHPYKKLHHMQAGVGHYGVFSGRRWQTEVYPMVRDFILQWE